MPSWMDWIRPPVTAPATVDAVPVGRRLRSVARSISVDTVIQGSLNDLGVPGVDPGASWTVRPRGILSYGVTETLYRQWPLARRVVDLLPAAATTEPWRLDDETRRDAAGELDERLGLQGVVRTWGQRARLYGGAIAVPYYQGQGPDLSQPMRPGPRGRVTAVQVFAGEELSVLAWDTSPGSPRFGWPLLVMVTPLVSGASVTATIHASRFVWLGSGMPLPPLLRQVYPNSTDLPILEAYWTALGHRWQVDSAAATLAPRIVEGVLSIPGLAATTGSTPDGGTASAVAREFARSASVVGVGVLDTEMQYQRHAASMSGFGELDATTRREVAAVEGIPQRVLFGDEPGGLANDGSGSMRQWASVVGTYQRTHLGPSLIALYRLLLGDDLQKPRLVWPPMERPTALEIAQIRQAHAGADASYIAAGVLLPEEVRQRWTGSEYVEELTLAPEDGGEFAAALRGELPGDVDPLAPSTPAAPPVQEVTSVQETALNGAQISSAKEIVLEVAAGRLPRDSGVAMLMRFFSLAASEAEAIMGTVGRGFAPATPAATDADSYAVPDAVAGNAAKALRWREEHGDAVQGGTETGWRRARQLAAGGRVSADDVVTIAAWWARHRDHASEPDAEYADEPWRDAGYVAGLLWGGRSGDTWATEARRGIE